MGHFTYASKVIITPDLRYVFSVGEYNGIYKWAFYGDKTVPNDLSAHCEEIQDEIDAKNAAAENELEDKKREGMFEQEDLMSYTAQ